MKILYYFLGSNSNMSGWQKVNFIDELESMGHQIKSIAINEFKCEENRVDRLKSDLECFKPDLFMTSCDDKILSNCFLDEISRIGLPSLLICFDNLSVPFKHKYSCSHFDLVWLTSWETEDMFKRWGAKTIFLPYAANPHVYKPVSGAEYSSVGFVGTCYGVRKSKIESLIKNDIPVKLYGGNDILNEQINPAKNLLSNIKNASNNALQLTKFAIGRKTLYAAILKSMQNTNVSSDKFNELLLSRGSLSFSEMAHIYSRSAISLGVTELWNTYLLKNPLHKIHLRCFEIPMCGGLQIVSRTEEMSGYFTEDNEIIYYSDVEEMVDKCRFYLKDDNFILREKLKLNARRRAINEHTWSHRFNSIFESLGVK